MAKKSFVGIVPNIRDIEQNNNSIKITILPELKSYIPPLANDEFLQLESNILAEGCREALIVWENNNDYVLIDGHNRYEICTKHNIPFKTELKEFFDIEAVKDWMINNQLGKRNVTEEVKSYLRGLQYKMEKQKQGGDRKSSNQNDYLKTHQRLAEQHKVGAATIQRDEKFYEGLENLTQENKELRWKILNREINLPKSFVSDLAKKSKNEIDDILQKIEKGNFDFSQSKNKENTNNEIKKQVSKLIDKFLETKDKKLVEEIKKILLEVM